MDSPTIAESLLTLHQSGALHVPAAEPEEGDLDAALLEIAADMTLHHPAPPPTLDPDAAHWAARMLIQAGRCLALRELPEEEVARLFGEPAPRPAASTVWSVHLAFRFLPSLATRSTAVATEDIVTRQLEQWIADWSPGNWPEDAFLACLHADTQPMPTPSTATPPAYVQPT